METIKKEEFRLIGLKLPRKTSNEDGRSGIDCGNLWQKFESEKFAERIPNSGNEVYAVYFDYENGHTGEFSYFLGCKAGDNTEIPEGMKSLVIPENSYFKVTARGTMPDCIANSWKDVWNSNLDRAYKYDFEVYDQRSTDWNNAEVDIFISSK